MNLNDFSPDLQFDPPTFRYKRVMKQKTSQTEQNFVFIIYSAWIFKEEHSISLWWSSYDCLSEKFRYRLLARLMWSKGTCYGHSLFLCSKNGLLVFLKKKVDRQDLILMFYFDSNIVTFLYVWWQYQIEQLPMDLWGTLFHCNHIDFYLTVLVILNKSLTGGYYVIFQ